MAKEKTFMMIKPDGVRRGLKDEVLRRVRAEGFQILDQKMSKLLLSKIEDLYAVHKEKHFFESLLRYAQSGPVFLLKLEREDAVATLRRLIGATDPAKAEKGTIRGDLKDPHPAIDPSIMENLVHASDSVENAQRELGIFFPS